MVYVVYSMSTPNTACEITHTESKYDLNVCFCARAPVCVFVSSAVYFRDRISVGCLHPLHQTSSQQGF